VDLVNYGGMITVDSMVLGNSGKRGQSGATGFFGEGVKVEINRLTASGIAVTYVTPVKECTLIIVHGVASTYEFATLVNTHREKRTNHRVHAQLGLEGRVWYTNKSQKKNGAQ
jgi:hypothetical protein